MRTKRIGAALLASLAIVAAACGDDSESGTTAAPTTEGGSATTAGGGGGDMDYMWTPNADLLAGAEGQVNIVAWAGYIEDGSTDPAYDWTTPFETMTGCQVNVKLGNSSTRSGAPFNSTRR